MRVSGGRDGWSSGGHEHGARGTSGGAGRTSRRGPRHSSPGSSMARAVGVRRGSARRRSGQRVWKRQPSGGWMGLGTSPSSGMRRRTRSAHRVGDGRRREQRPRVRVERRLDTAPRAGRSPRPAQVHHHDPLAHVADDREVVPDEQVREPQPLLEVHQQSQDLGLDGDVERGDRLVEHDQLGLRRERTGDRDALSLAARELMGVARHRSRAAARPCPSAPRRVPARSSGVPMLWMTRPSPMRLPTVIRGLSDMYGSWNTIWKRRRSGRSSRDGERADVHAVEQHAAGRGLVEARHDAPQRGLAAAALAHETQRLAAIDGQRDAIHGMDDLVAGPEEVTCAGPGSASGRRAPRRRAASRRIDAVTSLP